jgi:hypothetical protein
MATKGTLVVGREFVRAVKGRPADLQLVAQFVCRLTETTRRIEIRLTSKLLPPFVQTNDGDDCGCNSCTAK